MNISREKESEIDQNHDNDCMDNSEILENQNLNDSEITLGDIEDKNNELLIKIDQMEKENDKLTSETRELASQYLSLETKGNIMKKVILEIRERIEILQKSFQDGFESINISDNEMEQLKLKIDKKEINNIFIKNTTRQNLDAYIEELGTNFNTQKTQKIQSLTEKINELETKNSDLKKKIECQETEISKKSKEVDYKREENYKLMEELPLIQSKIEELKGNYDKEEKEKESILSRINEKEKFYTNEMKKLDEFIEHSLQNKNIEEMKSIEAELSEVIHEKKVHHDTWEQRNEEIEKLKNHYDECLKIKKYQTQIKKLKQLHLSKSQDLQSLVENLQNFQENAVDLQREEESLSLQLLNKEENLKTIEEEFSQLQEEIDNNQQKILTLKEENDVLLVNEDLKIDSSEIEQIQNRILKLKDEFDADTNQLQDLTATREKEISSLNSEIILFKEQLRSNEEIETELIEVIHQESAKNDENLKNLKEKNDAILKEVSKLDNLFTNITEECTKYEDELMQVRLNLFNSSSSSEASNFATTSNRHFKKGK